MDAAMLAWSQARLFDFRSQALIMECEQRHR
jgi:hypothetical protein